MTAQAELLPITPGILAYPKAMFPPAMIEGMVRDGEYVVIGEQVTDDGSKKQE